MDNSRVIRVDLATKVLYFLFNFFAPISLVPIACASFDVYNIVATLVSLLALLLGLRIAIYNLSNSNKYLVVEDKVISICKGDMKNPQVIQMLEIEAIEPASLKNRLLVHYGNQYIKLLHTSCSIVSLVCWVGPLIFIPLMKNKNVEAIKLAELYHLSPDLFEKVPPKPSAGGTLLANLLAWGFCLFVVGVGLIGVVMIPFYPFMGE